MSRANFGRKQRSRSLQAITPLEFMKAKPFFKTGKDAGEEERGAARDKKNTHPNPRLRKHNIPIREVIMGGEKRRTCTRINYEERSKVRIMTAKPSYERNNDDEGKGRTKSEHESSNHNTVGVYERKGKKKWRREEGKDQHGTKRRRNTKAQNNENKTFPVSGEGGG